MTKFLLTLLLSLPGTLWALELKVGDILLQPLYCWSCSLIEAQEKSIYSHMGLVIETTPQVKVIEALGTVRIISLSEFNSRTKKKHRLSVRRFKDENIVSYLETNQEALMRSFVTDFADRLYDKDFLWDNVDEDGQEMLYCSELITKLLSSFLNIELPMKRMKYDINREHWIKWFGKNPPDGKWGNAPADFEKSPLFFEVGEL